MTRLIERANRLYRRMNDALGRDVDTALLRGEMTLADLEDAVQACAGCTGPGACAALLDRAGGTLTAPPGYCRNRTELEGLQ